MKKAIALARKKGLIVRRGMHVGWSVTLPNGAGFHALSDSDMVKYVRAY